MDWRVINSCQSIHILVIGTFDLICMKKLYLALLLAGSLTTAFAQDHPGMKTMDLTAAQMAHYMEISTKIYEIYLRYIAPEDIHVYSIDEVFIDVTGYLQTYRCKENSCG